MTPARAVVEASQASGRGPEVAESLGAGSSSPRGGRRMTSEADSSGAAPWVPQDDYTPEALAACEKALRTIISRIGTGARA